MSPPSLGETPPARLLSPSEQAPVGSGPGPGLVRLQRVLADAGIAARRVCEQLIEQGRVAVNGQVVRTLPAFVDPSRDRITVEGRPLPKSEPSVYIMLNKPERVLTVGEDEPGLGRTTVLDLVTHPAHARLFPVGRMEWDTMGLILLTNDGEVAYRLTHPRFRVPKTYHALVKGVTDEPALLATIRRQAKLLAKRVSFEKRRLRRERSGGGPVPGQRAQPMVMPQVRILKREVDKCLLEVRTLDVGGVSLRDLLLACGLVVRKLTRVAIGPVQLKSLPVAQWRELTSEEVESLRQCPPWDGQHQDQPLGLLTTSAPVAFGVSQDNDMRSPRRRPAPRRPARNPGNPRASDRTQSSRGPKKSGKPGGAARPVIRGEKGGPSSPAQAPRGPRTLMPE